jgi:hypothetical protein
MSAISVIVDIEDPQPVNSPGDKLAFSCRLQSDEPVDVERLEIAVLWYSTGKGDEDTGLHFFENLVPEAFVNESTVFRLATRLPASPLSYEGLAVQIHWCVRIRAICRNGKQVVGESGFRLGSVARPQEVAAKNIVKPVVEIGYKRTYES